MKLQWCRVSVLAMVVLLASCSGKNKDESGAASGEPESSAVAGAAGTRQAQVKDLGALVDLIVAQAAELPRSEFDPAALAAKLGKNPQAHFEWVRDHTWWAPYRGLLRGSRGVLLDRVGSNLDRAVLLGDLLRLSGHEVRLAHAELPQSLARELLDKVRPTPGERVGAMAQEKMPDGRKRAFENLIPGLGASLKQELVESKRIDGEAGALASTQSSELLAMTRGAANKAGARDEQAAINAMRDYWWVERKESGKWIAMDVLLPDAQAGGAFTSASSTSTWNAKDAMPGIPEADWHTVQIRVVIERYSDGVTTESTVLNSTMRPAEVLERPIMLVHMPKPWPDSLPDPTVDPNALGNAAVNVKEWVPILEIGDELVVRSGFADNGNLIAEPFSAKRDIAATGGAGFMTGFSEALGGGEAASSALTAEWLDYEIHVPGEAAQRIRRPVFDVLGPVRRSAKAADFDANTNERLIERYEALLSSTHIFLQVSDLTGAFLTHLRTKSIAANQAAFKELSKERDTARASALASEILDRLDTWGPLPVFALWRGELGEQSRASFIDRPNVLNYRVGKPVVNGDRGVIRELIDVASNSTSVNWGGGQDPFEVRLRQGVSDTIAEVLALGGDFRTTENTATIFAKAGDDPNRGKLVDAHDADAIRGLEWPEDAVARLSEDVNAGFIAVVLRQPISDGGRQRVGWWRIDPASGETIGVMDTGFHSGMDERVETELEIAQLRNALRNWMKDNAARIRAARARANVPWDAIAEGDAELLQTADRVIDVLRQAALGGF